MQRTKSVLLFGNLVPLSRDFVVFTKLSSITGDVGEILLELLKSVFKVPDDNESLSLKDFKKKLIHNVISFINNMYLDDNKQPYLLEDMFLIHHKFNRAIYEVILFRLCYIFMPIIDYLEIDDRLLVICMGWSSFLSTMYEELRSKEKRNAFFNIYRRRIVEKIHSKRYISLLERYLLPNSYKIEKINLLIPFTIMSNSFQRNKIISMRTII